MKASIGNTRRYIPVHTLAVRPVDLCKVTPAAHILTGCDATSKFGTKLSALKADPVSYLSGFGNNPHDPNLEQRYFLKPRIIL